MDEKHDVTECMNTEEYIAHVKSEEVKMTDLDAILMIEGGEGDYDQMQAAWQHLIDNGTVWSLQGFYGRTATQLIESGACHAASQGKAA
jgi:hypothetical protein